MSEPWQSPDDPFAKRERVPALSFKGAPVGAVVTATVERLPEQVHERDFDTGERAYWDAEKREPKFAVVTLIDVNGTKYSLWAPKPSAMFQAIVDAQIASQAQIAVGGTLKITFTGEKPNERNPQLNPTKQYSVEYTPPSAFGDPWSGSNGAASAASSQPTQQSSAPSTASSGAAWSPTGATPGQQDEPPF